MMKKILIKGTLSLILLGAIAISGFQLYQIYDNYAAEAEIHEKVLAYKPTQPPTEQETDAPYVNQNILDLQAINADVVGWLTIGNTEIDYPFVWCKDNNFYLRRNINKEYAEAGTVFMDYRCERDFSLPNTILYGHHVKNDSMFGTLKNFDSKAFFDANQTGKIFLTDRVLELEIIAFMNVKSRDKEVYKTEFGENDKAVFFEYIKENAKHYRETEFSETDMFVTLSTCSYESANARMVIVAKAQ